MKHQSLMGQKLNLSPKENLSRGKCIDMKNLITSKQLGRLAHGTGKPVTGIVNLHSLEKTENPAANPARRRFMHPAVLVLPKLKSELGPVLANVK